MNKDYATLILLLSNLKLKNIVDNCQDKSTLDIVKILAESVNNYCKDKIIITYNEQKVQIKMNFTIKEAEYFLKECAKYIRNGNTD